LILRKVAKKIIPDAFWVHIRKVYRYITSLRYVGRKYQCPFCKGNFSLFLAEGVDSRLLKEKRVVGAGYRLNAICPRCFSSDRERLLYLYLKKSKPDIFFGRTKLLHVAPEYNLGMVLKSCAGIEYVSVDLNAEFADFQMDITDIRENNDTYDVIICNHVLEHIQDDLKAMRELYRVLKKGGFAILQVPISYQIAETIEDGSVTCAEARKKNFGQEDHVRIYGIDYVSRLVKVGFAVNVINFIRELDSSSVSKYALLEDEKIFLCSK